MVYNFGLVKMFFDILCVACQRGLHFFLKKNEAKKTTPSKLTHSKFFKNYKLE